MYVLFVLINGVGVEGLNVKVNELGGAVWQLLHIDSPVN